MKIIALRFDATCRDCGAALPAGTRAKWYGKGRVYGIGCHADGAARSPGAASPDERLTAYERGDYSEGAIRSHYDRSGFYSEDGAYLGRAGGRCEDAPCCGCCQ